MIEREYIKTPLAGRRYRLVYVLCPLALVGVTGCFNDAPRHTKVSGDEATKQLAAVFNEGWSASPFDRLGTKAVTWYAVGSWDSTHHLFVIDLEGSDPDRVRKAIFETSDAAVGRQELQRTVRENAAFPSDVLKNFKIESITADELVADRYTVFEFNVKRLDDSSLHRQLEIWANTRGNRVLVRRGFY